MIYSGDRLIAPRPLVREPDEQRKVEERLKAFRLYQFEYCPFCIKVRRVLKELALPMELRDCEEGSSDRTELVEQGGQLQVPCLRIEHAGDRVEWMYESDVIIAYLRGQFPSS